MEKPDADEQRRKEVEKVLGEPVFIEFTEPTATARRNLLFASCIAIAFWYWGLKLSSTPSLVGFQLENLSPRAFTWCLFWSTLYLEGHFLWLSWDGLQEWRLRQSGRRVAFQTGSSWGNADADYPSDARQSTLYRWWRERLGSVDQLQRLAVEVGGAVKSIEAENAVITWTDEQKATLLTLSTNLAILGGQLNAQVDLQKSLRVPASLERFDAAFGRFLRSQNLRWIALEFGIPTLAGLAALAACIGMLLAASNASLPTPVLRLPAVAASSPLHSVSRPCGGQIGGPIAMGQKAQQACGS